MNWIKDKIKRFYKLVIGLLIPVALAAPLALPPEDTTYRLEWRESFLNQKHFSEAIVIAPDRYASYEILPAEPNYQPPMVLIRVRKEYPALTTEEALKKETLNERSIGSLKALTIYGTYYEKYEAGTIKK